MDENINNFLTELADLFDKYDVDAEAVEDEGGYYSYVSGVEFGITDVSGIKVFVKLPVSFDSYEIRTLIE